MGGFSGVQRGRTAGESRGSAGRQGNLALIAVHCRESAGREAHASHCGCVRGALL